MAIITGILVFGLTVSTFTGRVYASELESAEASTVASSEFDEATEEDNSNDESRTLTLEERLENVKNSVVQINCIYVDEEKKRHIVKGAAGTLIGKEDGTEYVITSLSAITPSKELKEKVLKDFKVAKDKWSNIEFSYEVVVQNDVAFSATLDDRKSEELDLGIFTLSQNLTQRTPMTILYSETGNGFAAEDVYAFGYPDVIVYGDNAVYYPNERVNRTSGKISNTVNEANVQWIEHNATIALNNCGGPLINSEGEMIGINSMRTEGTYYYSVSSNSIVKLLDGMGIEYNKISIEEKAEATSVASVSSSVPETQTIIVETVPIWLLVIVAVLAVLLIGVLILVTVMMIKNSNKPSLKERQQIKKEEKERLITPETFDNRRTQQSQPSIPVNPMALQNNGTGILGGNSNGETTILSSVSTSQGVTSYGVYGSMFRRKLGENIIINKPRFVLGKDEAHVDYCIKKNGAISRQHAAISVMQDGVYVEDLGSTNGTFVNGNKLSASMPRMLNSGDVIKLADEEFEFRK